MHATRTASSSSGTTSTALQQLKQWPQWLCWSHDGKTKKPVNAATGKAASSTDATTWSSYESAVAAAVEHGHAGVGFVFTADDPFCGIDLDTCIDSETGGVAHWAREMVEELDSYTEISPSGAGLHIIVSATKPAATRSRIALANGNEIEIYDAQRFFCITGHRYSGDAIEVRSDELEALYARVCPPAQRQGEEREPRQQTERFTAGDAELLSKMRHAGQWKLFRKLYDAGDTGDYTSHSEADAALCGMLAFWTSCNPERMDRLFRGSKLMRSKWNEKRGKSTYAATTIAAAIRNCEKTYKPGELPRVGDAVQDELSALTRVVSHRSWSGRSGPTDHDVYTSLTARAWRYGKAHADGGVEVAASVRDLTLDAGISCCKTVKNALHRLEHQHKLIKKLDAGGPRRAARYLLLAAPPAPLDEEEHHRDGLPVLRKLRHASPRLTGAITKREGRIIDHVHRAGRVVTPKELAGHATPEQIALLVGEGLLTEHPAGYLAPTDIEEKLEQKLESSGCNELEREQRERIERQRNAFRRRNL